jgi:hypothetical protein
VEPQLKQGGKSLKFRFLYSCLILALLISQFAVFKFVLNVSAQEPTIFSDGFESGDFSAWTSTVVLSGCSTTVESANPHHGNYNQKSILAGAAGAEFACAIKNIGTSHSHAFVRCYVKYANYSGLDAGEIIPCVGFWFSQSATNTARAGLGKDSSGNVRWAVRYYHAGSFYNAFGSSTPTTGVWYCVELEVQVGTSGYVKFYVDGSLEISVTDIDNSARQFAYVHVGPNSVAGTAAATVYTDCVVVADAYIGPEVGQTYTVDTSFQTTPTWTVLTQVTFSVLPNWNLQESFTALTQSSFNVIPQWSFQESWNTLTTSVLNIVSGWTSNLQWTLEVLKFGAQFYTVDLTWLTQTTWETLTTNTFNVVNTWSLNPTWTLDVYHWISTGIVHYVDLTWQTVMEWSSSVFHDVAVVDWGLMALGLAIVAFSLAAVGFVFTRRKAKSES